MRYLISWMLLGFVCFPCVVNAKRAANRPYAASLPFSAFYARCIPDEAEGSKGITQILCVDKDGDTLLHEYKWYNKSGLHLGWSPVVGEVAVMRFGQEEGKDLDNQIELSFYLGGKLLKSYTTSELVALGARTGRSSADLGPRAIYRTMKCEQVPNTNDYHFGLDLGNGKLLRFNVLTGNLCRLIEEKKTEVNPSGSKSVRTKYSLIDVEREPNNRVERDE